MNTLIQRQLDFNLSCSGAWDSFASHRDHVTSLLRGASETSRLCVLGAGNCNDLDLSRLLTSHQSIHLVDVDSSAVRRGVARQKLQERADIHRHGDTDLTGMLGTIASWSPESKIREAEIAACIDGPSDSLRSIPGPFEVVASTCVMSQLIKSVLDTIGENHPQFLQVVQAMRIGHLRLLLQLLASSGTGLMITDVVSSDTYPALASLSEKDLYPVLIQLIQQGNFFHGMNPAVIVDQVRQDPVLKEQIATVEPIGPWLWDFGPRHYAVVALKIQRK